MLCAVVTKRTKCGGLWWCLGCPRGLKILGSRALRAKPAKAACPRDRAFLELHPACSHRYRDPGTTCRTAEYRGSNGTPPTPDPIPQLGKAGNFHKVDHWWAHSQKKTKSGSLFVRISAERPTSQHRKYLHHVGTTTSSPQHQNFELQSQNSRQ